MKYVAGKSWSPWRLVPVHDDKAEVARSRTRSWLVAVEVGNERKREQNLLELFQGSAIANIGFNATSAQLVQFVDSSQCLLVRDNVTIQLDGRAKNFADIDGDRAIAVPTYIGGFTFQCTQ